MNPKTALLGLSLPFLFRTFRAAYRVPAAGGEPMYLSMHANSDGKNTIIKYTVP